MKIVISKKVGKKSYFDLLKMYFPLMLLTQKHYGGSKKENVYERKMKEKESNAYTMGE